MPAADTNIPVLAVARDTRIQFEESFYEDPDTQAIPITPSNPAIYPAVAIYDPNGQVIRGGVASPVVPGVWLFDFLVPGDAVLSSPDSKWKIQWTILTVSGRTVVSTNYFDVVEPKVPEEEDRSPSILTRHGKPARASIRLGADPYELSAEVHAYPACGDPIARYAWVPTPPGASLITPASPPFTAGTLPIARVIEGDEVVFYFDTPALDAGEYMVFWDVRESATDLAEPQTRMIRVPPNLAWFMFPSLRALIDKLQKRAERTQAYSTADLYEYLLEGVGILNQVHPQTDFGLMDMPMGEGGTRTALYYAAGLHAMRAQHILAVETDFSFSGQTVPLTVDRRSGYADAIQKMSEGLEAWKVAKLSLFRDANLVGASSVRMTQRRFQNFVVPISRGQGGETFALLSGLGLL